MTTELTINATGRAPAEVGGFSVWTGRFLASTDVKAQSLKTYKFGVEKFKAWLTAHGIESPTRNDIIAYRDTLKTETNAKGRVNTPATVATYMAAVKSFYTFAETEIGARNLAKGIRAPQTKNHKKDALTTDQARKVLNGIDRSTLDGKRDYALMALLMMTGLRTCEAAGADCGDRRNKDDRRVLWIHGKGRDDKDDFVVLPDMVDAAINDYLTARKVTAENAPLFTSRKGRGAGRLTAGRISHIVKGHLRNAGYDETKLTAHSLRHTAVTLALRAGSPIQQVQAMARHKSINTTLIYAHNIDRTANAAEDRVAVALAV